MPIIRLYINRGHTMNNKEILNEYNKNIKLYDNFQSKMEILLKELLEDNLNYHDISSRAKTQNSLENKLIAKEDKYTDIKEVTDIVGCRIISYFENDVEEIVEMIRREFEIDEVNSINKKDILESNKFGYLSYHLVCSLNKARLSLPEYKKYKDIKIEIQIRSILQHAWAEIEHDIGYKNRSEIPSNIRRKFSRIAGLLETADENFCEIKDELSQYNDKIKNSTEELYKTDLNLDSLYQYTLNSPLILEMDTYISQIDNDILNETLLKDKLTTPLTKLIYTNIKTIKELDTLINSKKDLVLNFAKEFFSHFEDGDTINFERGISYGYLTYLLVSEHKDAELITNYVKEIYSVEEPKFLVDKLVETYETIIS